MCCSFLSYLFFKFFVYVVKTNGINGVTLKANIAADSRTIQDPVLRHAFF